MSQQEHDPARRALLRQSITLAGAAALGGAARPVFAGGDAGVSADAAVSDPHPALGNTLTRIGFGSCSNESKPQPIWDAVLAKPFDLFMFLGDNIYGDTRDMEVLSAKYALFGKQPGFVRLRKATPISEAAPRKMWER